MLSVIDKKEMKMFQWFFDEWKKAFHQIDPAIDIRVWPDIGDPKDIVLVIAWKYPPGELKKYPNLKCIASMGAGVDHILNDPERPQEIPVVRIVDKQMAIDITQYVVAATLYYVKRFDQWAADQQKKLWKKEPPFNLANYQIGIMGLGHLGQHAAKALNQLGLRVIGWSQSKKEIKNIECFDGKNLKKFLSKTNILICMLPLTKDTINILNEKNFNCLPQGAYLINVARGHLLVEKDLLSAIESGQIAGAYLDVFREEPLPQDHPFWTIPNIKITPHIASITNPKTAASQIIENYHRACRELNLINTVDLKRGY